MYSPKIDHIDQLIRFMEALAKIDADDRPIFIEALEMILHPPRVVELESIKFT